MVAGKTTAEHATPNALSRSVPIAFTGPGFVVGRYERLARTVDIAPTLAALLGITRASRSTERHSTRPSSRNARLLSKSVEIRWEP